MKDYSFGNLMDWGSVLNKLQHLKDTGELNNHQEELIKLLRCDINWRLREAAVEASSTLTNPSVDTVKLLVELIKREDIYYNVRIMAAEALSTLVPVVMKSKDLNKDLARLFIDEANHEVTRLLSSPAPPIFHDALDITLEQIQKVLEAA
jgi:hypothetical protein